MKFCDVIRRLHVKKTTGSDEDKICLTSQHSQRIATSETERLENPSDKVFFKSLSRKKCDPSNKKSSCSAKSFNKLNGRLKPTTSSSGLCSIPQERNGENGGKNNYARLTLRCLSSDIASQIVYQPLRDIRDECDQKAIFSDGQSDPQRISSSNISSQRSLRLDKNVDDRKHRKTLSLCDDKKSSDVLFMNRVTGTSILPHGSIPLQPTKQRYESKFTHTLPQRTKISKDHTSSVSIPLSKDQHDCDQSDSERGATTLNFHTSSYDKSFSTGANDESESEAHYEPLCKCRTPPFYVRRYVNVPDSYYGWPSVGLKRDEMQNSDANYTELEDIDTETIIESSFHDYVNCPSSQVATDIHINTSASECEHLYERISGDCVRNEDPSCKNESIIYEDKSEFDECPYEAVVDIKSTNESKIAGGMNFLNSPPRSVKKFDPIGYQSQDSGCKIIHELFQGNHNQVLNPSKLDSSTSVAECEDASHLSTPVILRDKHNRACNDVRTTPKRHGVYIDSDIAKCIETMALDSSTGQYNSRVELDILFHRCLSLFESQNKTMKRTPCLLANTSHTGNTKISMSVDDVSGNEQCPHAEQFQATKTTYGPNMATYCYELNKVTNPKNHRETQVQLSIGSFTETSKSHFSPANQTPLFDKMTEANPNSNIRSTFQRAGSRLTSRHHDVIEGQLEAVTSHSSRYSPKIKRIGFVRAYDVFNTAGVDVFTVGEKVLSYSLPFLSPVAQTKASTTSFSKRSQRSTRRGSRRRRPLSLRLVHQSTTLLFCRGHRTICRWTRTTTNTHVLKYQRQNCRHRLRSA